MKRTFIVEMDEDETATIWRMAALTGIPAAQIVRHLHRCHIWFQLCVDLTAGRGDVWDEHTGRILPMVPGGQEKEFHHLAVSMMGIGYVRE